MKYVLTNWKMYLDRGREADLFGAVQARLRERFRSESIPVSVIVCPSFVSLVPLHAAMDPGLVRLGAQNCFAGDGKQTTDFGDIDFGSGVALQPDGRVVVVGNSGGSGGDFALAAITPPWFFFLCRFFTGAGIGGEYAAIQLRDRRT